MRAKMAITLTALLLLSGCTSFNKKMDPWLSHSVDDYIMQHGPPTSTADVTYGKVYSWRYSGGYATQNFGYGMAVTQERTCLVNLMVGPSNTIESYNWQGHCR